jgi:hypothetical protein
MSVCLWRTFKHLLYDVILVCCELTGWQSFSRNFLLHSHRETWSIGVLEALHLKSGDLKSFCNYDSSVCNIKLQTENSKIITELALNGGLKVVNCIASCEDVLYLRSEVLAAVKMTLLFWVMPWRWRHYVSPKWWYVPMRLHGVMTQNNNAIDFFCNFHTYKQYRSQILTPVVYTWHRKFSWTAYGTSPLISPCLNQLNRVHITKRLNVVLRWFWKEN